MIHFFTALGYLMVMALLFLGALKLCNWLPLDPRSNPDRILRYHRSTKRRFFSQRSIRHRGA